MIFSQHHRPFGQASEGMAAAVDFICDARAGAKAAGITPPSDAELTAEITNLFDLVEIEVSEAFRLADLRCGAPSGVTFVNVARDVIQQKVSAVPQFTPQPSKKLSTGAVVGIAVGATVLLGGLALVLARSKATA